MARDLSGTPKWDILRNFYRDFDNGRKRGCVEKWKKKMPKGGLERDHFEIRIHTEFLKDRHEKLNKEFRWTYANKKKLIVLDQRFRELHRNIARTFEATKRDIAALTAQNHKWYREYELESKRKSAPRTTGTFLANTSTSAICFSGTQTGVPSTSAQARTNTTPTVTRSTSFPLGNRCCSSTSSSRTMSLGNSTRSSTTANQACTPSTTWST